MSAFKHLLVPTDFEEPSSRALEIAIGIAQSSGAGITLAHFWAFPAYPYVGAVYSSYDYITPLGEAADTQMSNLLAAVQKRVPGARSVCRMGVPWEEILSVITEVHADLVVMGTHGRRGIRHVLLGSVAEKVVRLSPVPVLTVPASADPGTVDVKP
jgi:nucleotide-binding universal stress UspA family protein